MGLKKKSIKGGKWKEFVPKVGFDHRPLLPSLPSVMLYFYGKAGEQGFFPSLPGAAVSSKRKAYASLSLHLERPSG